MQNILQKQNKHMATLTYKKREVPEININFSPPKYPDPLSGVYGGGYYDGVVVKLYIWQDIGTGYAWYLMNDEQESYWANIWYPKTFRTFKSVTEYDSKVVDLLLWGIEVNQITVLNSPYIQGQFTKIKNSDTLNFPTGSISSGENCVITVN